MKVMVFDLPADKSGALAILKDFFNYVKHDCPGQIEWIFIVSTSKLDSITDQGITILKYPKVKKGWISRIFFEIFQSTCLVKKYKPDVILSLQNITILHKKTPQVVYVHQALPYSNKRFSYFKRYEFFLAVYSDIFRILIGKSVKTASAVIVQTQWLKDAIKKRHKVNKEKIKVIAPSVFVKAEPMEVVKDKNLFFYPTTPYIYKNIDVILQAAFRLISEGFSPRIVLTIVGNENNYAKRIEKKIDRFKLRETVLLEGRIPYEKVQKYYSRATLLFPSTLESFGLPLLEARLSETFILAGNTPFAREILNGYDRARYFEASDSNELAMRMKEAMEKTTDTLNIRNSIEYNEPAKWSELITLLYSACGKAENDM